MPRLTINQRLDEILAAHTSAGKQASDVAVAPTKNGAPAKTKRAEEANTEPDVSNAGPTDSPTKNVDDKTEPNVEGKRSQENDDDVAKLGVESEGTKTARDAVLRRLGVKKAEGESTQGGMDHTTAHESIALTGEDPENEISGVKGNTKEDPGTESPARIDNSELDGSKYAGMTLDELVPIFDKQANDLFLSVLTQLSDAPAPTATPAAATKTKQADAAPAGTKQASNDDAIALIESFIAAGAKRADNVARFYYTKQAEAQAQERAKQANVNCGPTAGMRTVQRDKSTMTLGKKAEGMPPMDPAMAMGGGGMPPPAPMGGDMGGAMGGADAGGGAPPAPGGGGEMSAEEIIEALRAAGMSDEEIAQILSGAEGGDAGGAGGGDAPPPPEGAGGGEPPPPEGAKAASAKGKPPLVLSNKKQAFALLRELLARSH